MRGLSRTLGFFATLGSLALASAAQTPATLRYLDPAFGTQITRDLVYGRNFNPWKLVYEDLKLDLYEPAIDTAPARPALVYVHGGLFWYGSKSNGEAALNCTHFATRGYVCVAIDYRLALSYQHGGLMPDAMAEDIKAAVRFLRKNAAAWRIDPERIALVGDSVGGDGAITASQTTWEGQSGNPGQRSDVRCVIEYWGHPHVPITRRDCGIAIVHGTDDPGVPFVKAQQMYSEATTVGAPARLVALTGAAHAPWDRWSYFAPEVTGFLYEVLVLQQEAGIVADPGWSTAGSLTLRAAGWEGQTLHWFLSGGTLQVPVLNWGTLRIDPALSLIVAQSAFPALSGASKLTLSLPLPPGLTGTLYWQGLYLGGVQPVRLSNLVTTSF